jgi:hypothetical protein
LGIQFSRKKLGAFIRGDLSDTVLHRALVLGAQTLGTLAAGGTDDTSAMVRFHAKRVQTGWEALADLFNGNDYRASAQCAAAVAAGFIYLRMPQMALLYIQKCCGFIEAGNLQFVPTYGRPPVFSEDLHEILVTLSQVIYWANYLFLMRGGPDPRATAKLEGDFRQELLVGDSAPTLFYIELIFYCSRLIRFSLRSVH